MAILPKMEVLKMVDRIQALPEPMKELEWIQDARQRGEAIVNESERREGKLEPQRKMAASEEVDQYA